MNPGTHGPFPSASPSLPLSHTHTNIQTHIRQPRRHAADTRGIEAPPVLQECFRVRGVVSQHVRRCWSPLSRRCAIWFTACNLHLPSVSARQVCKKALIHWNDPTRRSSKGFSAGYGYPTTLTIPECEGETSGETAHPSHTRTTTPTRRLSEWDLLRDGGRVVENEMWGGVCVSRWRATQQWLHASLTLLAVFIHLPRCCHRVY